VHPSFLIVYLFFVQVIPLHLPPGDTSTERTLQIDGTSEQLESAKQLVNEVISEVCWLMLVCRSGRDYRLFGFMPS
jgi:hypothetical protein